MRRTGRLAMTDSHQCVVVLGAPCNTFVYLRENILHVVGRMECIQASVPDLTEVGLELRQLLPKSDGP